MSDYAGMKIYIAFHHTESAGQYLVKIDDIEIRDKDTEFLPGDANCDGVVNMPDIIAIVNYFIGLDPDPFCSDNADVNGDGVINVLDVTEIVELCVFYQKNPCPEMPGKKTNDPTLSHYACKSASLS